MLSITESTPNPTRRQWLQIGGLGLIGLSLPHVLRAQQPRRRPAADSCVLFLLHGGPSQLDTWDMKPSAPDVVRGVFQPARTSVPGMHITEHLPRLAQLAHRFNIVRSMTHRAINHNTGTYTVTTGHPPLRDLIAFTPSENDFPHLGAQVTYGRPATANVPAAVSLPDPVSDGPYTTPGQNGGFLGARYTPFAIYGDPNDETFSVAGLQTTPNVGGDRIRNRRQLLQTVDSQLGRLADERRVEHMADHQQRAFALLTSDRTRRAFAVHQEPALVRDRYGRHKYGQSLLLARRLVEAGVRLVTVYWGGKVNNPNPHWDTHFNNNRRLRDELLPPFDQCFSAFLEDMSARGLLERTMVVCTGEFGRTPRFGQFTGNGVNETGRDHWSQCYSMLTAGGSSDGGRIVGRSDRFAAYPADNPLTPQDLQATVLRYLGIDPQREVVDGFGRRVALSEGRVRGEFFGNVALNR